MQQNIYKKVRNVNVEGQDQQKKSQRKSQQEGIEKEESKIRTSELQGKVAIHFLYSFPVFLCPLLLVSSGYPGGQTKAINRVNLWEIKKAVGK